MTAAAQTLNYADRRTYARGLRELEGPLSLTMEQEWLRDERWKAHDGSHFSAALEYAYARGTAGQVPRSRSVGEPPSWRPEAAARQRQSSEHFISPMPFAESASRLAGELTTAVNTEL